VTRVANVTPDGDSQSNAVTMPTTGPGIAGANERGKPEFSLLRPLPSTLTVRQWHVVPLIAKDVGVAFVLLFQLPLKSAPV
jgi:hypothetical protein